MLEIDLINLVQKIVKNKYETNKIEIKSAHINCPKRLFDTLSSFSNQDDGGVILFGIDESKDFEVVGVYDVQDLQKKLNEQCKQMTPIVRPIFTIVQINGKNILSAEIPSIDISNRPCYYNGVGRIKGSYVRIGDSDEKMSEYEIYSYEAYRKKYEDDIEINTKADIISIDKKAFEDYIYHIKEKNPKLSKLDDTYIYHSLNMIKDKHPSLACILIFGIYPQMFYPQYTVNAMVIDGYKKGDTSNDGTRFIDNKRIEGNIGSILKESLNFIRKNMKSKTNISPITGERIDSYEYPIIALRELVLNALIHRDYSIHTRSMPIEIVMYKNRLEIRNPGGLYGRLNIDQLGKVIPDTRNPILARTLESISLTENRFSGIPTIYNEIKKAGLRPPVFEDLRYEFKVTLFNEDIRDLSKEEHIKLDLINFCHSPKSRLEIAKFLEVSPAWAYKKYIAPLLKSKKLFLTNPNAPKSKNQKYYS